MTEAEEFWDKSSMVKSHNQDIPSIFTGFDKAKVESSQEKKKPLIASKIKSRGTETVAKNDKAGCSV